MNPILLSRLVFDLVAAALLLFAFSYWWLGNLAHEIAGTSMFLLLILHNIFNRRFYNTIAKPRREPRGLINIAATLLLLATMLVLLVSSVLISKTLSPLMASYGGFTVRQIHILAAYWALVIVAVHLGLRWPLIMSVTRNLFGISKPNATRTRALQLAAFAVAVHGVWSSYELGLGTKLTMRVTLDWWNFEEAVVGFFAHCIAVAGLYMYLTYYAMKWIQYRKRAAAVTT